MAKKVNRICTICGIEYKGHTNQKYCEACRPYVYKKETSLPNGFHRTKKKANKKLKQLKKF